MNQLLLVFVISLIVIFIMIKQINSVTSKLDRKTLTHEPSIYAKFAAFIQEKVRAIKTDIDHTKETEKPIYVLKNQDDETFSLEFLSDTIRKLVFFETMNSKRRTSKDIERELFETLNALENFLKERMQLGETLADNLRDELFEHFNTLQNE